MALALYCLHCLRDATATEADTLSMGIALCAYHAVLALPAADTDFEAHRAELARLAQDEVRNARLTA